VKNYPIELRHGSGVMMTLDPTRLLLAFKKGQTRKQVEALLQGIRLVLEDGGHEKELGLPRPMQIINHTDQRSWVRSEDGRPIDQELFDSVAKALARQLDWIGPVYQLPNIEGRGGLLCPLPNVLMIKPVSGLKAEIGRSLSPRLSRLGLKEVLEKSKYLAGYRYYVISDPNKQSAYQLQAVLLDREKQLVQEARFENMPMLKPVAVLPNDPLFAQQWDMTQIQAGGVGTTGWDISTGINAVVVCVLDTGCDLTHPDLTPFPTQGINLGTMMPDGSPDPVNGIVTGHGTCCGGIVAGRFNNALGATGVAGNCGIMPLAFHDWTDAEVAAGINFAADNGASVISMSFGQYAPGDGIPPSGWDFTVIDPAITHAFNDRDCVLCAATGNENASTHNRYPARHPLVIACGASDQVDNRKSPTSPDGETWWGSNFGVDTHAGQTTGVSVVAPGVLIPAADIQGTGGFNTAAGVAGDYFLMFNGTSSATPHVAGLAALIRSQYATLTNVQVRNIIERTADKVGVVAYAETAGFANGTRNQQMGYGRINVFRALDFADVMIKDYPADMGIEPSTPPSGDFWDFSDIVTRIFDDSVFVPDDPSKSSNVERGQTNYLYIRVTNNGARGANNVVVNARITPYVGLEFVYPTDWTAIDATHVSPTPVTATFATIPAGGSVIAKFTISPTQVEDLWGWISSHPWHPCLLASVNADNDYAFATANSAGDIIVVRRNNLAQRNLSVIDVLASASASFPFLAGNRQNTERVMEVRVDRSRLPKDMRLLLALDDDTKAFPLVDLTPPDFTHAADDNGGMIFLERTSIETTIGCCRGVLTLEKGSRFDCPPSVKIGKVDVKGGVVIMQGDKRFVEISEQTTIIRMEKQPRQLYPLALQTSIPANAHKGQQYMIRVAQRNQKEEIVGGATVVYYV
jgi:subtilisin family serine protease